MCLACFLPSSCTTRSGRSPGSLAKPQQETLEAGMPVHNLTTEKGGDQAGIWAGRATSQRATVDRLLRTGDHRAGCPPRPQEGKASVSSLLSSDA